MSISLLLEDAPKPWCDIYVNKITASEYAGEFGLNSGEIPITVSVISGLTVASFVSTAKYTIDGNFCTVYMFSPTVTSNANSLVLEFFPPIAPTTNWVDDSDCSGQGLFSTGTASNNNSFQVFSKDTSSKLIRASGIAAANGASGRISMNFRYELVPV